jgi:hypothetical protein
LSASLPRKRCSRQLIVESACAGLAFARNFVLIVCALKGWNILWITASFAVFLAAKMGLIKK